MQDTLKEIRSVRLEQESKGEYGKFTVYEQKKSEINNE